MNKNLEISIYKRKSGNSTKFNYYDTEHKVYITPSEIYSSKTNGRSIVFIQKNVLTKEEYQRAMNNVIVHGTKSQLINEKDPKWVEKIINEGGFLKYIKKLEKRIKNEL